LESRNDDLGVPTFADVRAILGVTSPRAEEKCDDMNAVLLVKKMEKSSTDFLFFGFWFFLLHMHIYISSWH
jgi:hypothetical protein